MSDETKYEMTDADGVEWYPAEIATVAGRTLIFRTDKKPSRLFELSDDKGTAYEIEAHTNTRKVRPRVARVKLSSGEEATDGEYVAGFCHVMRVRDARATYPLDVWSVAGWAPASWTHADIINTTFNTRLMTAEFAVERNAPEHGMPDRLRDAVAKLRAERKAKEAAKADPDAALHEINDKLTRIGDRLYGAGKW